MSDSQGQIDISKFKKCKRLSKGGFGVVYKVENKETGEFYAAKVIDCGDDEEQCNKLIDREVKIMLKSKHPTIIKFIGYSKVDFQGENNITIVMDLATQGSLSDIIKKIMNNDGPPDYNNTCKQKILIGISRGMKYLHDHNIIHRDLKTGNILIDSNFDPHITDFGMSKFIEIGNSYSQSEFGGTIPYQAPEIFKNEPYDRKVDVYAFGILMYEIISDSFAFPELSSGKMSGLDFKLKVINDNYRPKLDFIINQNIQNLIEKCWSSDHKSRPDFSQIFDKLTVKDYFLNDVDVDEVKIYIEDITADADDDDVNDNEKIVKQIDAIEVELNKLKEINTELLNKSEKQNAKIDSCMNEIAELKKENEALRDENSRNREQISSLQNEINQLKSRLANKTQSDKNIQTDSSKKEPNESEKSNKTSPEPPKNNSSSSHDSSKDKSSSSEPSKEKSTSPDSSKDKSSSSETSKEKSASPESNDQNCCKIKEGVTISEYNTLSLQKQLSISLEMSEHLKFFKKINDFLTFIANNVQTAESIISIIGNENECLTDIAEEYPVQISHQATEILFHNKILESESLPQQLKSFEEIRIEVKYPTNDYESIYNSILKLKSAASKSIFIAKIDKTFENNKVINYISFDSNVKEISSFEGCSCLREVFIPSSVETIGKECFKNCSLRKITFSDSSKLTKINNEAFYQCYSLKEIIFPSSLISLGERSFNYCQSLKEITIPSSVKEIGEWTFYQCNSLNKVTFLSSDTNIKGCAFYDCAKLSSISLPKSLKSIESCTFCGCKSLTEIEIPSSVSKILSGAFSECTKLVKIDLSKSKYLKEIDQQTFYKCTSLREVYLPSSLTKLNSYAFELCTSLTEIKIPSSVKTIYSNLFDGCSSLKTIELPSELTEIGSGFFAQCSSLTEITIPSSVTKIKKYSFSKCLSLTKMVIKSPVIEIEESFVYQCPKLETIIFENNDRFKYFENQLLIYRSNADIDEFDVLYFANPKSESLVIPSFIKKIASRAFYGCDSLKEVIVPSTVTKMCEGSFMNCINLIKISFPSSLTQIEESVLRGCSALTEISIPSSVTQINKYALRDCSSLVEIVIPSSVTKIEEHAFSHCSSLKQISIPSSVTQIAGCVFSGCSSLVTVMIPSSITQIENHFFNECKSLSQISIPSSVTQIGNYAFNQCTSLKKIEFEATSSVTQIGNYAFYECSSLAQISIPSSVTQIGNFAFQRCSSLEQISIPPSVQKIGKYTFSLCKSLKKISIPSSLKNTKIELDPSVEISFIEN